MIPSGQPLDLEQALAVAAYLVVRHGDAYVPTFERLEREFEEEQKRVDNKERARQVLADLMRRGVKDASVA